MRTLTAAVALVAALALTATPASARTPRLPDNVEVAKRIGYATFPDACSHIEFQAVDLGDNQLAQAVRGWTWPGHKRVCTILLNRNWNWARKADRPGGAPGTARGASTSWALFCRVVVHEIGHLAGHRHVFYGADRMLMYYAQLYDPERHPWGPCGTSWVTHPLRYMSEQAAHRVRYPADLKHWDHRLTR